MALTTKEKRKVCYAARDTFFECHRSCEKPSEDCSAQLLEMMAECPKSWAKSFKGKAIRERFDANSEIAADAFNKKLRES